MAPAAGTIASTLRFPSAALVTVHPFLRQPEGDETVIGRADTGTFLAVPTVALEILDQLAAGASVGEAQATFQQRHGELPDLEDLLCHLEGKGLVAPWGLALETAAEGAATPPAPLRFHFENFPLGWAQRLCGRHALTLYFTIIGAALVCLALDPVVLPGWQSLFSGTHLTAMMVMILTLHYGSLFFHELAHLVAARAVGVSSRLGIGHRLWSLVAETDMSGLWGVPREKRYLPFLAGPLFDATWAAVLILGLFGAHHRWWPLSGRGGDILRAWLLICLLSLLWQCFLFVRTDFYYALSNFFGCKNLLGDTEEFLRAKAAALLPWLRRRPVAPPPQRELRVVRFYSAAWILGRMVALTVLIFIQLPLLGSYLMAVGSALAGGHRHPAAVVDALVMCVLVVGPKAAGAWLWLRGLVRARGARKPTQPMRAAPAAANREQGGIGNA
jgi:putative peptide zinc metalloprotease protein